MADGGEGTVQSMVDATNGRIININVNDPLFRTVKSFYGILGDGEYSCHRNGSCFRSSIVLCPGRNPLKTSTFGTGELIKDALDKGCRKIIIGLGAAQPMTEVLGWLLLLELVFLILKVRKLVMAGKLCQG